MCVSGVGGESVKMGGMVMKDRGVMRVDMESGREKYVVGMDGGSEGMREERGVIMGKGGDRMKIVKEGKEG